VDIIGLLGELEKWGEPNQDGCTHLFEGDNPYKALQYLKSLDGVQTADILSAIMNLLAILGNSEVVCECGNKAAVKLAALFRDVLSNVFDQMSEDTMTIPKLLANCHNEPYLFYNDSSGIHTGVSRMEN
jgi:hypothetical protein